MLKPIDHDPDQRDFDGFDHDHFRADRKHKATSSMEELELGCVDAYSDLLTSHEELLNITHAAQLFFHRVYAQRSSLNEIFLDERVSTLNAIQQHLMMNPDGTLMPLSWRQRLFHTDRQALLEHRLTAAKQAAEAVVDHVSGIPRKEASSRDVALIHFFMLENVHWFYRTTLRMNLLGKSSPYIKRIYRCHFSFISTPNSTLLACLFVYCWLLAFCLLSR